MNNRWVSFALLFLGLWLISTQFLLSKENDLLFYSDVISGGLLLFLGWWTLITNSRLVWWLSAGVGMWLQVVPLLFWAKHPATYLNDTLVGVVVIALSVILPHQISKEKPMIPKGWSYNPSSWPQRIPIAFLGIFCWFISRYLAAYQLGYIDAVWDPFFSDGTVKVLTSKVSKFFPVSDAGLGALAYTLDTLLSCSGDENRWHRTPWMVVTFGIMVVPVGLISIFLIIMQPLAVGAWCTLCLLTALIMVFMVAYTIDEVVVVAQFLRQQVKAGKPFWKAFFYGGNPVGAKVDTRTPSLLGAWKKTIPSMFWGVTFQPSLILASLIGIFFMMVSSFVAMPQRLVDMDHVMGAIIISISIIANAEAIRSWRYINFLCAGFILAALFWRLCDIKLLDMLIHLGGVFALCMLSYPKGRFHEKSGVK
jgi:uncharacterized membrane protein